MRIIFTHYCSLSLPYAAPPTGDLRWRAPQEPARWPDSVIRKATAHGPSCPQVNILEYQSEDCLFVDIYTPSANRFGVVTGGRRRRLPVMLWIHGGAWVMGSRDFLGVQNPLYIVEHRDVVVVTMNYRLGPLGFMVGARNGTDPIDGSTIDGNFGLLDQRAAMKWVQENIAQFGGDPESVTLWGESAGAMSIGFHLTSPGSEGLFHRVIMESNVLGVRYRTRDEAAHIGEELARSRRGASMLVVVVRVNMFVHTYATFGYNDTSATYS